jgi:magnesium transporter
MFRKRKPPVGSVPGALGPACKFAPTKVKLIRFNESSFEERTVDSLSELTTCLEAGSVSWIDVQGLGDYSIIEKVGEIFSLHPLVIADVVNIPNRPKVEDYDDYLFIVTNMVTATLVDVPELDVEQVSIFIGKNYVITFQEDYDDVLEPVRNRLRQAKGTIRKCKSDYLAYALLDTLIDGYYPVIEVLGEYFETLEEEVVESPTKKTANAIYYVRQELMKLRHAIWPQRDTLSMLMRTDNKLIKKSTNIYLRDTYDHCVQIIDVMETYREICGSFTDLYLSSISNRLNEVMKVLAVISTIFIPLSFLASVYGMNFRYMPELEVKWAYPAFWVLIILVASTMLYFFYKRGWIDLGGRKEEEPPRSK